MLKLASDSLHLAIKHTVPCTFGANMAKQKACKAQWCHYKTRFAAREKNYILAHRACQRETR